jgi:hypothetical protein
VVVAFLGVGLWGVFTAMIAGPSRTLLQRGSPQRAHGRVLSADFVAGSGAELLGVAGAGVLVGAFGVQRSIVALGLVTGAVAVALQVADGRDRARAVAAGPVPAPDPVPAAGADPELAEAAAPPAG